jgi:hypothetical protein
LEGYISFFSTSQNQNGARTNTTYYNGSNQYCTNCNMKGYNIKACWAKKKEVLKFFVISGVRIVVQLVKCSN